MPRPKLVNPHERAVIHERIRAMAMARHTDPEIAAAVGLSRGGVNYIRLKVLGMKRTPDEVLEARRQNIRRQQERGVWRGVMGGRRDKGAKKGSERALENYRRFATAFATEHGWPTDLKPRSVQILQVLFAYGPMTRIEIAEAIGLKVYKKGQCLISSPKKPGPLMELETRGLVCRQAAAVRIGRRGFARALYMPTIAAINMLEAHVGGAAAAGQSA
jgi:hypothetical protein